MLAWKRQKDPTAKAEKFPSMFLPLIIFWSDAYEVNNNFNPVQLCSAIKFIPHSVSCFCVNESVLTLQWNTGVHENALSGALNQEKFENGVCLP